MLERDFLRSMARDRELSPNQEQIFLMRFAEEMDYEEIATKVGTSAGACLKQMGEVYKKFEVDGNRRGKENRLRIFLLNQCREAADANACQKLPEQKLGNAANIGSLDEYMEEMAFIESYKIPVLISNQKDNHISALKLQDFTVVTPSLLAIATPYHNLPTPDYTNFINRETEMAQLLEMLSGDRAPQISGVAGFGKSTLVLEAAYRCLQASRIPQAYPSAIAFDAIIFTSAQENYLTGDIGRAIAQTLNRPDIASAEPAQQLESIKECLSKIRALLIVDNLESLENPPEILSFLSDLPPTVKVVITTC